MLSVLTTTAGLITMNSEHIFIVIPAFNEEKVIGNVVRSVRSAGSYTVVVVDDGSTDRTFMRAQEAGALCLRHPINRGKGAAAKTAIEAARLQGASIIVTMDGDGQHDASDIATLVKPILNQTHDVVLGTRSFRSPGVPWYKALHNHIANMIVLLMTGLQVHDSQSGFRAYSPAALALINTRSDTYEYETEVIQEIARYRLRYTEVPMTTRYTEHSMKKPHRQTVTNGIKTVYKVMWNRFL